MRLFAIVGPDGQLQRRHRGTIQVYPSKRRAEAYKCTPGSRVVEFVEVLDPEED